MPSRTRTTRRLRTLHPLGHLPSMQRDALAFQRRVAAEGDVLRIRLGAIDTLWVSSPATLQELLRDRAEDYEKSPALTRMLRPIIGDGILSSQGSRHRRRRAIVAPAFSAGRIARYGEAIVRETDRVLADVETREQVDVGREMMRLTLEVVAATLLCANVESDVRAVDQAVSAGSEAFTTLFRKPLPLPPTRLTPAGRKLWQAGRDLDRIVYRVIAERRRSQEDPGDVLSMLLGARDADTGEGLTDEELRDEVMTLLLAGHETTANALTWALQLIATHPDVARRLRAEVDGALAGRSPTYADLPQLPYALCVFKEAMRLFPPAFMVGRRALTQSRLGAHHVPKGQILLANIYGVHRSPEVFDDPDSFRPERFADNAEKSWPKGAYVPFSVGPRVCVGNHFALMEGQLVLARIAQRLELEGSIERVAETEPLVTLRPKGAVTMRVRRRTEPAARSATPSVAP